MTDDDTANGTDVSDGADVADATDVSDVSDGEDGEDGAGDATNASSGASRLTTAFLVVLVLWGLYLASRISTWPYASDRPFPTLVLSALLVLSAVQLFKMRFPTVVDRIIPSPDDQENELQQDMQELRESEEEASTSRLLQMVGVITLLPIVVYYLGFLLVFPVFVFGLIYYLDRSLKKAGAATTVFTVLWYVVFIELLNIPIWLGQLFGGTIG